MRKKCFTVLAIKKIMIKWSICFKRKQGGTAKILTLEKKRDRKGKRKKDEM